MNYKWIVPAGVALGCLLGYAFAVLFHYAPSIEWHCRSCGCRVRAINFFGHAQLCAEEQRTR
jgi:hypothetical protein